MLETIWLSAKLSTITTVILFLLCAPFALILARAKSKFASVVMAVCSLPLVLPPTVLGFYLLVFLSPMSPLGSLLAQYDIKLVFNFTGLVIASVIYSLPFMLNPLASGMAALSEAVYERCYLMQKSFFAQLFFVILPNIRRSLVSAIVMCFAHTMGEFGVVMMIGGSRAGETKVASIAVFEALENLDYDAAAEISLVILGISVVILIIAQVFGKRSF